MIKSSTIFSRGHTDSSRPLTKLKVVALRRPTRMNYPDYIIEVAWRKINRITRPVDNFYMTSRLYTLYTEVTMYQSPDYVITINP
jgi:hypothetical protein